MTTAIGDELQQLSGAAERLARKLSELAKEAPAVYARRPICAAAIRRALRLRKLRAERIAEGLFADPAWDMMLDLFAAKIEGRQVSITSLGIAAGVPATTALRWTTALIEQGLFVRVADPTDQRRALIELSPDAEVQLRAYLEEVQSSLDLI